MTLIRLSDTFSSGRRESGLKGLMISQGCKAGSLLSTSIRSGLLVVNFLPENYLP